VILPISGHWPGYQGKKEGLKMNPGQEKFKLVIIAYNQRGGYPSPPYDKERS
jgi:hypothetical protein